MSMTDTLYRCHNRRNPPHQVKLSRDFERNKASLWNICMWKFYKAYVRASKAFDVVLYAWYIKAPWANPHLTYVIVILSQIQPIHQQNAAQRDNNVDHFHCAFSAWSLDSNNENFLGEMKKEYCLDIWAN